MALAALQSVAGAAVLVRLARGRERRAPLAAARTSRPVSVVIPARDEEARIGPCLEGLRGDPDVLEVIVVDDCSSDGTAELARSLGARVIPGRPLPDGWVGKPWALEQGLEAAAGEVVVSLDADTRPRPGLVGALAAALEDADLVSAGARFECDTAGERWLHPSMLATLVYRFGPSDVERAPRPSRAVSNGQCTAVERERLVTWGGYRAASGHMTDDAALARALARNGWRVAFLDGADLVSVDMHDSAAGVWREWGRSIAMPGVTPAGWQAADLGVIWLALGLPPLRALTRRAGVVDWALLALRFALLAPLRRSYATRGPAFWLSPLADPAVAVRYTLSALRPTRAWRGREYRDAGSG